MDKDALAEALGNYSHLQLQYLALVKQRSGQSTETGYAQRLKALAGEIYAQVEHFRRTAPNALLRLFHGRLEAISIECQREI